MSELVANIIGIGVLCFIITLSVGLSFIPSKKSLPYSPILKGLKTPKDMKFSYIEVQKPLVKFTYLPFTPSKTVFEIKPHSK